MHHLDKHAATDNDITEVNKNMTAMNSRIHERINKIEVGMWRMVLYMGLSGAAGGAAGGTVASLGDLLKVIGG